MLSCLIMALACSFNEVVLIEEQGIVAPFFNNKNNDSFKICSIDNESSSESSQLSASLDVGQNLFLTPKRRIANPVKYIETLDNIINDMGYGFLLECRDNWKKTKGNSFRTSFFDISKSVNKQMILSGYKHLELRVDLYSSFQKVLLTYAHELLHVCQTPKSQRLFNSISTNISRQQYNQYRFIMELESFKLMMNMYEQLVNKSRRFCFEEHPELDKGRNKLYPLYVAAKEEYLSGMFVQRVISWYREGFKEVLDGIFDQNSIDQTYSGSKLGQKFVMKCLNKDFAISLTQMGYLINQPECK